MLDIYTQVYCLKLIFIILKEFKENMIFIIYII